MIKSFTSTKRKLLIVLKKSNESSMKEIMNHFDLSEIAIRRHLHDLIREQLVEEYSVKQEIGRPFKVYRLTTKGHELFPNQYKQLPLELLNDLEELHGREAVTELLNKRKEREINNILAHVNGEHFDEKVEQLVNFQAKNGYMIEMKKVEDGYELINYNCPIFNIATSYIQICANEKETLKKIFPNSDIISHSQIADGDSCCRWTITRPNE